MAQAQLNVSSIPTTLSDEFLYNPFLRCISYTPDSTCIPNKELWKSIIEQASSTALDRATIPVGVARRWLQRNSADSVVAIEGEDFQTAQIQVISALRELKNKFKTPK